jgi:aminopeptidase
MTDPRVEKLAKLLVGYSLSVRPGENVLVEAIDIPHDVTQTLIRTVASAGGRPIVMLKSNAIQRALMHAGSPESWQVVADAEKLLMQHVQCYLGVRGAANISELSDVPSDRQRFYEEAVWNQVHRDVRIKQTRWCVLRWPTESMAQMAEMSTEAFEDYFFSVCTIDYEKMAAAMKPLVELMAATDRIRLKGPNDTDLTFSKKGIAAIPCDGKVNIPDGEVFTAPIRDSVNGVIRYNAPSIYRGVTHNDVRFVFKDGKIVEATSTDTKHLNEILDTDEGARYIGEFSIGFNPHCTRPMKDILFDEKIAGSIHLTPGSCYDEAANGNKSSIHWDLVMLQTPDAGGGEIWFDDRLIRKDGRFVVPELEGLNPDRLA